MDLGFLCSNSKTNIFPNFPKALAGKTRISKLRSFSTATTSWVFSYVDGAICFPCPHKNMHKECANQQVHSFQETQLGCTLLLGTNER